jgi:hypothetical protein
MLATINSTAVDTMSDVSACTLFRLGTPYWLSADEGSDVGTTIY